MGAALASTAASILNEQHIATFPSRRTGHAAQILRQGIHGHATVIVVLPVNHVVDGQDPVFRTARGSKLSAAEDQNLVAFEADEYDEQTQSGWSVLVNGRAETIDEEAEIQRLSHLGLHPWVTTVERPFWIRIRPVSVSGRQTPGTS